MAIKATICKADLSVADMDRHYYADHALTLARHPSETDERMMVRLLAFALHAHERLEFGRGLSTDDEPALWLKDYAGTIELWIDVGLPDEKRLRKASGRAARVVVISYGERTADIWWTQNRDRLERLANLDVFNLPPSASQALAALASRNMRLQCSIQDGELLIATDSGSLHIEPVRWKSHTTG